MTLAKMERDYDRRSARVAQSAANIETLRRLDKCLNGNGEWLQEFNAAYKGKRIAGTMRQSYDVAKARFKRQLAQRLVNGWRPGDLSASIEAALK